MSWVDLLDIVIMAYLIYRLLLMLRGTRAIPMGLGLFSLLVMYLVAQRLKLQTVSWFMGHIFSYFVLVVIILFQHEIRRFLTSFFQFRLGPRYGQRVRKDIEEIVLAVNSMASRKIGALIVVERQVGLESHIETGIRLDARLSYDLLTSIFFPGGPLHDGAVIIRGDRIVAASCFLPLTSNPYLARTLGTRHRAAIGVTEESDALAIVVSEETGRISFAEAGRIRTGITPTQVRNLLKERLAPEKEISRKTPALVQSAETPATETVQETPATSKEVPTGSSS